MDQLPTGTVTFLFTDIEGSTSMLQRLGDAFAEVIEEHNRVMRHALDAGVEIRSEGDAFFYVFPSASDALNAACDAQRELAGFEWPEGGAVMVRIGMHTGEGVPGGDDYVGLDVHRAARIAAAGHGGQVLLSDATKTLTGPALSSELTLVDLGEHRFKDLEFPEHVYQVVIRGLAADFPPIASLEAAPNNLPGQGTAFVGRRAEAAELRALLEHNRLVTLTGPGGSGKTRLALHVASELQGEFPDGVFYVPLESVRSADLVTTSIADELGITDQGDGSVLDAVLARLGNGEVLLLIDNFEHVQEASPHMASLLAGAPRLKALVTSQSALRVRGEQLYALPPLARPDGVDLFSELAAAADPSFELGDDNRSEVDEVVALLDGMPLALELTAPRVRLFGLSGLRQRLIDRLEVPTAGFADLPERHRSLHDAIAWSYDLLGDDERSVLRQLSVFEGGFTLEAAESVVLPPGGVAAGVASLLDRSLLRQQVKRGEVRFSMLESIRQFSLVAAQAAGEHAEVARRHAEYFAELAERTRPYLDAEGQQVWMDRLADELDNIGAVLRWSRDTGEPDVGLRTAGSIWRFYHRRGHLPEAREWLDLLLVLDDASPQARAVGIEGLAGIAYWQADHEEAKRLYLELLELYRELGDDVRAADTVYALSTTAGWLGDFDEALDLAEQARTEYQVAEAPQGEARVASAIAWSTWQAGHIEEALELWTRARANYEALGDTGEVRQTDVAISAVLHQLGRTEEAIALDASALEQMIDSDDVSGTIQAIDFLGSITAAADPATALRLAGAADHLRAEAGGGLSADSVGLEPVRSIAAKTMNAAAIDAAWAEGAEMSLEEAATLALEAAPAAVDMKSMPANPAPNLRPA